MENRNAFTVDFLSFHILYRKEAPRLKRKTKRYHSCVTFYIYLTYGESEIKKKVNHILVICTIFIHIIFCLSPLRGISAFMAFGQCIFCLRKKSQLGLFVSLLFLNCSFFVLASKVSRTAFIKVGIPKMTPSNHSELI